MQRAGGYTALKRRTGAHTVVYLGDARCRGDEGGAVRVGGVTLWSRDLFQIVVVVQTGSNICQVSFPNSMLSCFMLFLFLFKSKVVFYSYYCRIYNMWQTYLFVIF